MSFLELVTDLVSNPAVKAEYAANPNSWLATRGFGDLSPAEIERAVAHCSNALAPDVAKAFGSNPSLQDVARLDLQADELSLERPSLDDATEVDLDADLLDDAEFHLDEIGDETSHEAPAWPDDGVPGTSDTAPENDIANVESDIPDAEVLGTTSHEQTSADDTSPAGEPLDETPLDDDSEFEDHINDDAFDGFE